MKPRHVSILLTTALVSAGAVLADDPSACDDARAALEAELAASGRALTRSVAEAARAALDACPPPSDSEGVPALPLSHPTQPEIVSDAWNGLRAAQCGFTDVMTLHKDDADLTKWETRGGFRTEPRHAHGEADATYTPSTGRIAYVSHADPDERGVSPFGLEVEGDGTNPGTGFIYLYGVPLPANQYANANGGCHPANASFCWATGVAETNVAAVLVVTVLGTMSRC